MEQGSSVRAAVMLLIKIVVFLVVVFMANVILSVIFEESGYNSVAQYYELGDVIRGKEYNVTVEEIKPFLGDATKYEVAEEEKLMQVRIQVTNNKPLRVNFDYNGYFFDFYALDGTSCTYYGKVHNEVCVDEAESLTDEIYLPAARTTTIDYIIGVPEVAKRIEVGYYDYTGPQSEVANHIYLDF